MTRYAILLAIALSATACTTLQTPPTVQRVEIPVPVSCLRAPLDPPPRRQTTTPDPESIARALLIELHQRRAWDAVAAATLEACAANTK